MILWPSTFRILPYLVRPALALDWLSIVNKQSCRMDNLVWPALPLVWLSIVNKRSCRMDTVSYDVFRSIRLACLLLDADVAGLVSFPACFGAWLYCIVRRSCRTIYTCLGVLYCTDCIIGCIGVVGDCSCCVSVRRCGGVVVVVSVANGCKYYWMLIHKLILIRTVETKTAVRIQLVVVKVF